MLQKELLLAHLHELISIVEKSESYHEAILQIRQENTWFGPWDRELSRRLRRLDQKVDALLERPAQSCRLSGEAEPNIQRLMTNIGAAARAEAIEHLRGEFSGAKQLVICDPYFLLHNSKNSKEEYVAGINEVIPETVKSIELFVKPKKRDADVAKRFNDLCRSRGIKLTCRKTDELHDRVWIVDSTHAFVVGASFNGLGNKCAFILELPLDDRRQFIAEVGLLRDRTTISKSA